MADNLGPWLMAKLHSTHSTLWASVHACTTNSGRRPGLDNIVSHLNSSSNHSHTGAGQHSGHAVISEASPQIVDPDPPAGDGRCKPYQQEGMCQSSGQNFVQGVHELEPPALKAVSPDPTQLCAAVSAPQRCRLLRWICRCLKTPKDQPAYKLHDYRLPLRSLQSLKQQLTSDDCEATGQDERQDAQGPKRLCHNKSSSS